MDYKATSALNVTSASFSIQKTPETKTGICQFPVTLSGTALWRLQSEKLEQKPFWTGKTQITVYNRLELK